MTMRAKWRMDPSKTRPSVDCSSSLGDRFPEFQNRERDFFDSGSAEGEKRTEG